MCSGVCVFFCLWHHIFCALCSCHSLTVYVWTGHPHCLYNSPAYNEELLKKKKGGGRRGEGRKGRKEGGEGEGEEGERKRMERNV